MVKTTDLAYIAGFFEGEGCVLIQRRKTSKTVHKILHFLHIEISQVDVKPLLKIQKVFGGRIYYDKRLRINKWIITNTNAANFLKKIDKFLITKKKESYTAIKFSKLIRKNGKSGRGHGITNLEFKKREALYWKLRELKDIKYGRKNRNSR